MTELPRGELVPDEDALLKARRTAQRLQEVLERMTAQDISPARLRGESVRSDVTLWQNIGMDVVQNHSHYGVCLRLFLKPDVDGSGPVRSEKYYEEFREFGSMLAKESTLILGKVRHVTGKDERWPVIEVMVANADLDMLANNVQALNAAVTQAIEKRGPVRRPS